MGYTRAVSRDLAKMLNRPFDGRNGSREYSKDKKRVAVLLAAVNARNHQGLPAAVEIIELGFGHGIVHVESRKK